MKLKVLRLLIMASKLTLYGFAFQFIIFSALWASNGNAQQIESVRNVFVDLELKSANLVEAFQKIEAQTEFRFTFDHQVITKNAKINISKNRISVAEALLEISEKTNLKFRQVNNYINVNSKERSERPSIEVIIQGRIITGKVSSSEDNEGLPGVNVIIKGTTEGTVTDVNGEYSLNVPGDESILVFSSVGFVKEEVVVGSRSIIDISIVPDVTALEEIVVIGYGSVKKSNLTGSVSKMTDEGISERPIASVGEALQGQLAGVRASPSSGRPGEELRIRIRGTNTINGDSNPLFVIDGVPRNGMSDINPSDISSIQILKDAASTSIYGARGGNGVVLIETKKGKGKPVITFESSLGFSEAERTMDIMGGPEFVAYQMYRRNLDYLRQGGSMSDPMSERPTNQQIPDFWNTTTDFVDWQNTVLQRAPFQNYNLSAGASGDIGSIYFSAGYMDQEGILKFTGFNRKNIRLNSTLNIRKNLRAGVNFAVSSSFRYGENGNSKDRAFHSAINASPMLPLDKNTEAWGFLPSSLIGQSPVNPLEELREARDDSRDTRMFASIFAEWDIIDGLTLRTQYSDNYDNNTWEYFFPQNVYRRPSRGRANTDTYRQWSVQNTLNYTKVFGDHNIEALIGQAAEKQTAFGTDAESRDFPYETIYTLNVSGVPYNASSNRSTYTNNSLFGRLSYNYKEKYLLTGSVRYDGSSRFGQNSKYGIFPAFTAGWKLNEEEFMKDIEWIDLLKLRVSWGMSGNDRIGDYRYEPLLNTTSTSLGGGVASGVYPANIANQDLQWEATKSRNIGFDFSVFKNRLQVNLDLYNNKTEDLLFNVTIPQTTGFGTLLTNLGAVENRGWEIDVTTYNLTGEFKWSTSANFSRNTNEILDMGDIEQFTTSRANGFWITRVGGPIGEFYSLESDGLILASDIDPETGNPTVPALAGSKEGSVKYIDHNGDGTINSQDKVGLGNNLPELIYGFTNTFSYKNFDLSVLFQGQTGGETMWIGGRSFDNTWGNVNVLSHWLRGYKPDFEALYGAGENPIPTDYIEKHGIDMSWDGETPYVAGSFDAYDDRRNHSSDYIRLKNITLSYNMPGTILNKTPLTGLRIYTSLENVKTWTNYPSFNPDSNSYGDNNVRAGSDYITYPLSRRAVFGLVVSF